MSHDVGQSGDAGQGDDLTRIGGIGSKIAYRLKAAGIRTYADLASRSADDITRLLPDVAGLSSARLDHWRDQARVLAAATPAPTAAETTAAMPSDSQHYESFLVRVLLNEDRSIRSTAVQRIRTGTERRWPGWERDALADFIAAEATSAPMPPAKEPPAPQPPTEPLPGLPTPHPAAEKARPATGRGVAVTEPSPPREREPAQRLRLATSAGLSVEPNVLHAAEPFTMTISVDLTGAAVDAERLGYRAVIVAKPMAGGPKRTVAHSEGLLTTSSPTIHIGAEGLPAGMYRLDGAVSLRQPGAAHTVDLAAVAEGLMVQVLAR